ncbi:hypothetical protein DPMN_131455 [Dreissena polymorpha]|uniref:Uncharacterized protein n=1 Tax=Dreissena polymorpha TaxID=45954 RepID=A0A9D4K028_DREPO|nr:hypothetical protein DPMN_131455 [Dreissena polymorpha]
MEYIARICGWICSYGMLIEHDTWGMWVEYVARYIATVCGWKYVARGMRVEYVARGMLMVNLDYYVGKHVAKYVTRSMWVVHDARVSMWLEYVARQGYTVECVARGMWVEYVTWGMRLEFIARVMGVEYIATVCGWSMWLEYESGVCDYGMWMDYVARDVEAVKANLEQIRTKVGEGALPLMRKKSVISRWRMAAKITS